MFNQPQHIMRLKRATNQDVPKADFLIVEVVDDMMERLSTVKREFQSAIALFGKTPYLSECMQQSEQIQSVLRVEEAVCIEKSDLTATPTNLGLEKNSADLILAPISLHWSNDLPGSLIQLRQTLRPDGLLMCALPGPDTLHELRAALLQAESELSTGAAMRVDAFTDIRDAGALLQRTGFALPVVDQDVLTVRYNTALELVRDLRAFGVTSHLMNNNKPLLTRTIISRMAEIYAETFADSDGRIRATFSFVSMAGWVPHESQQKPLKPGSATTRLADALKTEEIKL